jgi:hypothetical protein
MRNAKLAIMTMLVAGVAITAGPSPAAAYDYPWCLQGKGVGIPGDCSYRTYGQCMAIASGRYGYCNVNPRVAFERTRRGRRAYPDY